MSDNFIDTLTEQEIEKLRTGILQHDSKANTNNVFDLNKPPKVPYVHQAFPKMLYRHEGSLPSRAVTKSSLSGDITTHEPPKFITKVVKSEEQMETALAEGWVTDPPNFETMEEAPKKGRK